MIHDWKGQDDPVDPVIEKIGGFGSMKMGGISIERDG